MTDIQFGRLIDLPLREAWKYEALQFTPWLAENIDHLSEAISIPLELTGPEVAVENFSADILARNPSDDTVVLIENQLETTDHSHLGQIMTYLAGLNAQTVVWVAPAFREPHLSAIRWLNEHTADGFSFFAVKVRVVRIQDSPFAPIFEVVEQPDQWERAVSAKARASDSELSERRGAFWAHLLQRNPELRQHGLKEGRESAKWLDAPIPPLVLGLYVSARSSGVYLRGPESSLPEEWLENIEPFRTQLEDRLGTPFEDARNKSWRLVTHTSLAISDKSNWDALADWFLEKVTLYVSTLTDLHQGKMA